MYPLAFCVVHRWISDATGMRLTGSSYIPSLLARLACNSAVTLYHVSFATCPPSWRNAARPALALKPSCMAARALWATLGSIVGMTLSPGQPRHAGRVHDVPSVNHAS